MRRLFFGILVLAAAVIVLPWLWYTLFPGPPFPALPAPGMRIVLDDGVGVNVVEAGSGPPVVLVHGLPGSAYDWRETTAALAARGRRAIAYDRVGYGRSDPRTDGRYSPERNAEELVELLTALDLRDATVVGWSYGGVTTLLAALLDPSRIGEIVMVGTGGPDSDDAKPPEMPLAMRLLYSTPALRWRRTVRPVGAALVRAVTDAAFSGGPQPDWWLPGVAANLARWETVETYRSETMQIDPDGEGAFPVESIRLPALFVHGDDDRIAPVAVSRYLAGKVPGATLLEVPSGSHMLPVVWADELADLIVDFGSREATPTNRDSRRGGGPS
jgi:pimeloyl-ACP methyl ester carboxylesterase